MAEVLDPVLQTNDSPFDAEIVTLAPVQIFPSLLLLPDVSLTAMMGSCSSTTVTVEVLAAEQALAFVTVTV
jgi:hypothetical protein